MMESPAQRVLALVTVSPNLEELVIDVLLTHESTSAFTSVAAHGHGGTHTSLSLAEQVAGRKKQVQFQIELMEDEAIALISKLEDAIPGRDFHCCLIAIRPLTSRTR